jgi:hypothetical protein
MKFNTKVFLILSAVICLSACVLGLKIKNKEDDFGDDFEAPKESPEVTINHREEENANEKTKKTKKPVVKPAGTPPSTNLKKSRAGGDKDDDDDDDSKASKTTKKTLTQKWKELFSTDRSTLVSCPDSGSVVLTQHKDALANKDKEEKRGALIIAPHKAYNEWGSVEQGYGNSAYFFDYLDATLQAKIVKAFQDSFSQAMGTVPTDKKYEDPYALATMLLGKPRRMNEINAAENKELLAKLKIIAPKFDEAVWTASLDAFKVNKFISEYNWDLPSDGSKDQAKSLIDRFDLNGDGRLSNKEFILAAIVTNQKILGDGQCTNCFSDIIKTLIDPIFYYTDCNSDNGIGSEEIWKQLQNLINKTDYSFYKCIINDKFYRTNAVNDFILKASRVKTKGTINIEQFREAILLGYWGRQVNEDSTVAKNEINSKENRWPQMTTDMNCENMKANIAKEKVLEAEKAKEKCKSKKKM